MTPDEVDAAVAEVKARLAEIVARAKVLQAQMDELAEPCPLCGRHHHGSCLDHAVRVWEGGPADQHGQMEAVLRELRALTEEGRWLGRERIDGLRAIRRLRRDLAVR